MAHRRIGQGVCRFGTKAERRNSLDELDVLIDWSLADRVLALLYPAAKGEKAWPPLAMFKALLLATWYDVSDVALSEALSDRASFRRFCGFAGDEATSERTAFVRFRRAHVAHVLDRRLFEAIARDLESKGAACARERSSISSKIAPAHGSRNILVRLTYCANVLLQGAAQYEAAIWRNRNRRRRGCRLASPALARRSS